VVVDINSVLLFDSGKAELTAPAVGLVDAVVGVLKELHYPIQVNGFTDTQPIHNSQYSSNWDLSAARAIAVVKRMATDGIAPNSLVGAGYGEYHPVAANDTPEGMAMNRRVSIVVVSPLDDRSVTATPLLGNAKAASAEAPAPAAASPVAAAPPAAAPPAAAPPVAAPPAAAPPAAAPPVAAAPVTAAPTGGASASPR